MLTLSENLFCIVMVSLHHQAIKCTKNQESNFLRRFQKIPGTYKSEKPINTTGIDKIHLKCDCINGSFVNVIREPILYSYGLTSPPGHKTYKRSKIKLFRKINKSVLSHITFYLEDDDHKPVDFNGRTISFICQLIKFKK